MKVDAATVWLQVGQTALLVAGLGMTVLSHFQAIRVSDDLKLQAGLAAAPQIRNSAKDAQKTLPFF